MDGFRFDALTRSLTTPGSRRRAVTALVSGTLGLVGARVDEASAKTCKKIKNKKKRKKCLATVKPTPSTPTTPTTPTCTGTCAGKTCGDDGCGGSCGACVTPKTCQNGECVCTPNCSGKSCGPDGCGGSCGPCTGGTCSPNGDCNCGEKKGLCNGDCVLKCDSPYVYRPDCSCCVTNGSSSLICTSCCSGRCAGDSQEKGTCIGRANCAPCTFDAQCEIGECVGGQCGNPSTTICPG